MTLRTISIFTLLSVCILGCGKKGSVSPTSSSTLFTLLQPSETGIEFQNNITEDFHVNIVNYEYLYNGGGVGIGDINNDSLPDIFFTSTQGENKLYLNKGNLRFEDISQKSGILKIPPSKAFNTGVSLIDLNNDGFLDIYVCRTGQVTPAERANLLFMNNGDATFTEKAQEFGLGDMSYSNQATFFDYDHDGDLDVYIVNHPMEFKLANTMILEADTARMYVSDRLYRNNGDNTFTDVSKPAGISNKAYGLSATVADINDDGWCDVYVANDYIQPDYLYINNHDGTFTESLKKYFRHCSHFGMGADIADYNNDLLSDIMVLDMLPEDNKRLKLMGGVMSYDRYTLQVRYGLFHQQMRNSLQLNNGNGSFSEIGQLAGVSNTDWSWGPLFADFDNDGWKDLFIANGYRRDVTNMDYSKYVIDSLRKAGGGQPRVTSIYEVLQLIPSSKLQNYMFQNKRDLTFRNVSDDWGFTEPTFSNGSAYADLDADGDLDLVINNIDAPAIVYRNNAAQQTKHHFLKLRLVGDAKNREGIGSRITVWSNKQEQCQEVVFTRGFLSSVDHTIHFGLDSSAQADSLLIQWHDGKAQILHNIKADQVFTLNHEEAMGQRLKTEEKIEPIFEELTNQVGFSYLHRENEFVDFKREPLIPHLCSREGPCIAVADVDADGREDFFVGGASGSGGRLFLQREAGKFIIAKFQPWLSDLQCEDIGVLFFDCDSDGDQDLYIVSGGAEYEEGSSYYQDRLFLNDGKGNFSKSVDVLPAKHGCGSCVVAGDYDKDGDLDLFVGGRVIPGRYPQSPRSFILRNDGGKFTDVTASIAPLLVTPGLVSSAVWTDFDQDSNLDLVVTGEWMPIRFFKNEKGKFHEATSSTFLEETNGWWNTITASDIDDDGDMDFIAGNLGSNSRIKATSKEPVTVTAKDFDNNGSLDAVLSYYVLGKSFPIHSRDALLDQMRYLRKKYLRYEPYSEATLEDIFTKEELKNAQTFRAVTMESAIFENVGSGKFRRRALPKLAQFAPVNHILCHDFDGDGIKDLLLAGNSFSPDVETGRYDAFSGLFLRGDGAFNFTPTPVVRSGFFIPSDARSLAIVHSPQREFILVGNNDARMQVFAARKRETTIAKNR